MFAQNVIQVFSAVDVRNSQSTANYQTPNLFNTSNLNLTCSVSPISATLSGPLMNSDGTAPAFDGSGALQAGGNLLVDNSLLLTVTPASGTPVGPVNVCTGNGAIQDGQGIYLTDCFTAGYQVNAYSYIGQNPDTYVEPTTNQTIDAAGGVPPIDIHSSLVSGTQSVAISLADEGGLLTASTIFLTTNCTQGGVTGPATVTGNPIPPNPTPQQLTQTFSFNPTTTQVVGFVYDLSGAADANSLTINPNQPIPQVTDAPMEPSTFHTVFAPHTSFSTSECLIHTGELGADGKPACKLYTLTCTIGTGASATGAQCPVSAINNEVFTDIFDGPAFSLNVNHRYHDRDEEIDDNDFREGIGFLMAKEDWAGGPCTFDSASNLNIPCPQNLLTSFMGPGTFKGGGTSTNPNSTFLTVADVPEDRTHITVAGEQPWNWSRTRSVKVSFLSVPPNLHGSNLPGAETFVVSPIHGITYGISSATAPLPMPVNEPIQGDVTLANPAVAAGCPIPTSANPDPLPAANFEVEPTITFPADGQYLLHYFAQDCAGTQELKFTMDSSGVWSTNFRTRAINVDTTPPVITPSKLVLTGAVDSGGNYSVGEVVKVSYACSDAPSGAGVVACGNSYYATGTKYNTGTLTTQLNTKVKGKQTFTVLAYDGAGNSASESVSYTVK
jgi:hypothetical protein